MDAIYIAKTKEIIFSTRYEETKEYERNKYKLAQELKAMRMSKEWVECIRFKVYYWLVCDICLHPLFI